METETEIEFKGHLDELAFDCDWHRSQITFPDPPAEIRREMKAGWGRLISMIEEDEEDEEERSFKVPISSAATIWIRNHIAISPLRFARFMDGDDTQLDQRESIELNALANALSY